MSKVAGGKSKASKASEIADEPHGNSKKPDQKSSPAPKVVERGNPNYQTMKGVDDMPEIDVPPGGDDPRNKDIYKKPETGKLYTNMEEIQNASKLQERKSSPKVATKDMPPVTKEEPFDKIKEFKKPQPGKLADEADQQYCTLNQMGLASLAVDDIPVRKSSVAPPPKPKSKKCLCC